MPIYHSLEHEEMLNVAEKYSACDELALVYDQNDFKSFNMLTKLQKSLQDSCDISHQPSVVLVTSTLEGLPTPNPEVSLQALSSKY